MEIAVVSVLAAVLVICIWKLGENSKKVRDYRRGAFKDNEPDADAAASDSLKQKIEEYRKKNKKAQE